MTRRTLLFLTLVVAVLVTVPAMAAAQTNVAPGDILRISVWPSTELSGEFAVEETGIVYLPLLGDVRVGGVSIDRVRADLRARYGEVVRNPVVTVTPMFRITVTGEVQRPGVHMITPTNTLLDVIGMAGGFREAANADRVRIVRPGQVVEFDAVRALETGEGMHVVELRSGDHVVVPTARQFTWRTALDVVRTVSTLILIIDRVR